MIPLFFSFFILAILFLLDFFLVTITRSLSMCFYLVTEMAFHFTDFFSIDFLLLLFSISFDLSCLFSDATLGLILFSFYSFFLPFKFTNILFCNFKYTTNLFWCVFPSQTLVFSFKSLKWDFLYFPCLLDIWSIVIILI